MQQLLSLSVFFIVTVYCSHAFQYFFNIGATSFKPLYWHFITIGLALCLIVLRKPAVIPAIPNNLIIWLWVFILNSIICFFYSSQGELEIAALTENFVISILFFSFLVILLEKDAIRLSIIGMLLVVILSVPMNMIDFITPTWTMLPGRAAGFYENPTISAKMLVLMMVLTISIIPRKIRLFYCLFVGLGVFVTFSRGSWILWALAIIGLVFTGYIEFGRKSIAVVVASLLTISIVYSALTGGILEVFVYSGLDTYLTPGTLSRLGGSGTAFSDYSAVSRGTAALRALEVFSEHPWIGAGLGFDREWDVGAHNTYLRMAAEGGIVRLSIFIWLLFLLWHRTDHAGRVALVIYAISNFTTHDNLRQPSVLVILALISAFSKFREVSLDRETEKYKDDMKHLVT